MILCLNFLFISISVFVCFYKVPCVGCYRYYILDYRIWGISTTSSKHPNSSPPTVFLHITVKVQFFSNNYKSIILLFAGFMILQEQTMVENPTSYCQGVEMHSAAYFHFQVCQSLLHNSSMRIYVFIYICLYVY